MATFTQQRDVMMCCPYDSSHRVASRNFVKHTMQCELKYNSGFVVVCPHNASHRMPKHQLAHHLKHCDDLKQITRERAQYSNASDMSSHFKNLSINGNENEDEWSEDDAPVYDMYTCIATSDPTKLVAKKTDDNQNKTIVGQTVKETKNQKKRRKRKENTKTTKTETNSINGKQVNSVWNINN